MACVQFHFYGLAARPDGKSKFTGLAPFLLKEYIVVSGELSQYLNRRKYDL
jgi:hypothetical protein